MRASRIPALALYAALCMLTSCWVLGPSLHGRFNTYREPFVDSSALAFPRFDGIYVCEEANEIFFFQENGFVKNYPNMIAEIPKESFWVNTEDIIERVKRYDEFDRRESWGAYTRLDSALRIQHFVAHHYEFIRRSVFEYTGTILSDTAFVITSEIAYWFDKTPITGRFVYRFYPTSFTPDDSRIWFEKRRWYKKGRHPSRAR